MVIIYTLSDKDGNIRYVGKTSKYLKQRLYAHINECKTNRKSHKISWIKSLLSKGEKPIISILDRVEEDNWQYWESYWIEEMRKSGHNLTNLTEGGQGGNGYKHNEESKEKMSKSKKGLKLSEEHKLNISNSIKQKSQDNPNYNRNGGNIKQPIDKDLLYQLYIIDNLSIPEISKKLDCSEKKIFTNLRDYDIKKDKSIWKKQCASPKKIVLQYDMCGNFIKEWEGAVDVYENLKIKPERCCRGILKSSGGFIWKYK